MFNLIELQIYEKKMGFVAKFLATMEILILFAHENLDDFIVGGSDAPFCQYIFTNESIFEYERCDRSGNLF